MEGSGTIPGEREEKEGRDAATGQLTPGSPTLFPYL